MILSSLEIHTSWLISFLYFLDLLYLESTRISKTKKALLNFNIYDFLGYIQFTSLFYSYS